MNRARPLPRPIVLPRRRGCRVRFALAPGRGPTLAPPTRTALWLRHGRAYLSPEGYAGLARAVVR